MRSNTIRRAWDVDLLPKSKHVKISLAVPVGAYAIAQFICTILCSAYTTLLQKVTRLPVVTVRIKYHKVSIILSHPILAPCTLVAICQPEFITRIYGYGYGYGFCCGRRGSGLDMMTSARTCTGTTFVLIVLIRSVCCRRWKAKDVLLAFWLAALRLMDQSQEILLGHSVLCY